MIKQDFLIVVNAGQQILETSFLSTDVIVTASVDDAGGLTVKFVMPADELGRIPTTVVRYNRYETQKIRTVLGHTK